MTSVGTRIAGSASRTSISRIIRSIRRKALGLTAIRSNRASDRRAGAEPARLGAYQSMVSPCPQRCAAMSSSAGVHLLRRSPARVARGREPAGRRRPEDQRG